MTVSLLIWAFFFLVCHEILVSFLVAGQRRQVEDVESFLWHPLTIERLSGIFVLGVFPLAAAFILDHPAFFAGTGWPSCSLYSLFAYCGLILLLWGFVRWQFPRMNINRFQSILRFTPDIDRWIIPNVIIWMIYLAAYEWVLRGLILFGSIQWLGMAAAIALNCGIYAVMHIHKGWEQVVGALPFGLLLCGVTLYSGSIWPAYLLHLILSLSMETYVIRYYRTRSTYKKNYSTILNSESAE